MVEQISGTNETQTPQAEVDPWIAAFAALEPKSEETGEATASGNVDDSNNTNPNPIDGQESSHPTETGDGEGDARDLGGLDPAIGASESTGGKGFDGLTGLTEKEIEKYETDLNNSIRDRVVKDIANEFIKRGIRNNNGIPGATIDDPDIQKRDEDGVPHFFNPETGQEFRGDNPRKQAQEWVDFFNRDLETRFNNACKQYEEHLKKEAAPSLAVMKFAPKYEKLDEIRKGMFDSVVEDYEITDKSGKVIGYSCDLDKALALVERQISMIQGYAKKRQQDAPKQQAAEPVLDMKTSSGAIPSGQKQKPTSLAQAMEWLQDEQLAKIKR